MTFGRVAVTCIRIPMINLIVLFRMHSWHDADAAYYETASTARRLSQRKDDADLKSHGRPADGQRGGQR